LKPQDLAGIWAPISTPFKQNEEVDIEKLEANLEIYSTTSIRGYFALGSNGEACMLDSEERVKVLRTILKKKKDKIVMAGCSHESARGTINLTKQAAEEGADIVSVITPHYFKKNMTDDALVKFYEEVADKSPLPVMIYNAPGFAGGVQLSPRAVARLSMHPNIIGMKDTAPTGPNIFLSLVDPEKFAILAGSANFFITSLLLGAVGGVLSLANFLPQACCRLYELFKEGKIEEARKLQRSIIRTNTEISGRYGVAGVKAAMDFAGFYGGNPRLPLLPLSQEDKEKIRFSLTKFVEEYPEFKPYLKI